MATDVELLGCPWCGERRAEILEGGNSSWGRCYSCRAEGPVKGAYAEARAAWNTRPSPTQEQRDGVVVELTLFAEEYELAATRAKKDVLANQSAERLLALLQPQGRDHV